MMHMVSQRHELILPPACPVTPYQCSCGPGVFWVSSKDMLIKEIEGHLGPSDSYAIITKEPPVPIKRINLSFLNEPDDPNIEPELTKAIEPPTPSLNTPVVTRHAPGITCSIFTTPRGTTPRGKMLARVSHHQTRTNLTSWAKDGETMRELQVRTVAMMRRALDFS